jgi:hypothetical protein
MPKLERVYYYDSDDDGDRWKWNYSDAFPGLNALWLGSRINTGRLLQISLRNLKELRIVPDHLDLGENNFEIMRGLIKRQNVTIIIDVEYMFRLFFTFIWSMKERLGRGLHDRVQSALIQRTQQRLQM